MRTYQVYSDSLDTVIRIHNWKDKVQKKTVDLSNQMSRVLRGAWLTAKGTHAYKHVIDAYL